MSNLVEQLKDLETMRQSGTLNDAEFAIAKEKLLGQSSAAPTVENKALPTLETELTRIDREWELEREKFRVHGRYTSAIPAKGDGKQAGLTITIFGSVWTLMATGMAISATADMRLGLPPLMALGVWTLPAFGVFFIWMGRSKGKEMTEKYEAHQEAEQKYQQRRRAIVQKIENSANS